MAGEDQDSADTIEAQFVNIPGHWVVAFKERKDGDDVFVCDSFTSRKDVGGDVKKQLLRTWPAHRIHALSVQQQPDVL